MRIYSLFVVIIFSLVHFTNLKGPMESGARENCPDIFALLREIEETKEKLLLQKLNKERIGIERNVEIEKEEQVFLLFSFYFFFC